MKPRSDSGQSTPTSGRKIQIQPEVPSRPPESPKSPLRNRKKFFCEPAPWASREAYAKIVLADDDGAGSDAESVTSEYRVGEDTAQDSTDASASAMVTSVQSSGSEATPIARNASKKPTPDLQLPALVARRPDPAELSPLSSSSGFGPNKTPEDDVQVSASTAGEWVSRLAALQEVAQEHAACAGRIWIVMKEMFPEAVSVLTKEEEKAMQDSILQEIEMSRQLLEQHAQGLVSTDLTELRLIQSETKRANDRLERMDKLYAKELSSLRSLLDKGEPAKIPPREDYEPLLFLEPDERGCVLTLIEENLQELLLEKPELEYRINQKEYGRLQELFKKEKLSSLERSVAKLTEELEEVTKQVSLLEADNERLAKRSKEVRRPSSSSSRGWQERRPSASSMKPVYSGEGPGRQISAPVGKPKAGRPKRGAMYSRAPREAGIEPG